jgi:uncharacterized protein
MGDYKASKFNICYPYKEDSGFWVLANTYSGCVIFADRELADFMKFFDCDRFNTMNATDPDIVSYLLDRGFVVRDSLDEVKRVRLRFHEAKYNTSSLNLTLVPTNACNLGCRYCYQERQPKSFTADSVNNLKCFVSNRISQIEFLGITWYGGEPLLKRELISEISRYFIKLCKDHDVVYSANMVTNGTLLNKRNIEMLIEAGVRRLQVTIDGPEEIHNARRFYRVNKAKSYRTIISGIELCQSKIPVNIRINIDHSNIQEYETLICELQTSRLVGRGSGNSISLGMVKPWTENAKAHNSKLLTFEEFREQISQFKHFLHERNIIEDLSFDFQPSTPCGAVNLSNFLVSADGLLKKCWIHPTVAGTEIGNLRDGIDSSLPSTIEWHGYDPTLDDRCVECNLLPICCGGCPVEMMDKPDLKNEYCLYKQHYVRDNLLLAAEANINLKKERIVE